MTAFRRGVEVLVDLAEVNGQVFVNNVSLGIYAAMVRSRHYRRSKLHAVLDELPDLTGPVPCPCRCASGRRTGRSIPAPTHCWCPTTPTGSEVWGTAPGAD